MYLIFHSLLRTRALQVPHAFSFMVYKSVTFSYLHTPKSVKYNNFYFQSANTFLRTSEQNIALVQTSLLSSFCSGALGFHLAPSPCVWTTSLSRHILIQCLSFPLSLSTLIYTHSWRRLSGERRILGWQFSVSTSAVFAHLLALLVSGLTPVVIQSVFPCRQFRDFACLFFSPSVFCCYLAISYGCGFYGFIPFGAGSASWLWVYNFKQSLNNFEGPHLWYLGSQRHN